MLFGGLFAQIHDDGCYVGITRVAKGGGGVCEESPYQLLIQAGPFENGAKDGVVRDGV